MSERDAVSVKDFGAQGDGRHDDTAAIQKALDAAAETQGAVMVPAGVYLSGELTMYPGVVMQGFAAWSFRHSQGSIIRLVDGNARCLINLTGAFGAAVKGLCLQADEGLAQRPIHGILVDKPDYGVQEDTPCIDGCRIERFGGDGIRLERIWCFSVRHSHCFHNGGCGLYVRGWDGFILDNWFSGNGRAGFGAYEENASNTMTGNRIEWNRGGGIVIQGGSHYNITGNYIDRSGGNGVALLPREQTGCSVMALTGNVIYRSGKPEWGQEGPYSSAHGHFAGVRGLVFSGNAMNAGRDDNGKGELSPQYALVLHGLEDSIVKDNVMHQGALRQLLLDRGEHGPNVIIKDNVGSLKSA